MMSGFFLLANERVEVSPLADSTDYLDESSEFKVVGENDERWTVSGSTLLEEYTPISKSAELIVERINN